MSGVGRITGFTGHPKGETKTNLAVGIDHGKALTKRELKPKQSYRKGRIQKLGQLQAAGITPGRREKAA